MIQAVLFDMDGILLDSERMGMELIPQIAKQYGYTYTKDIYLRVMGATVQAGQEVMREYFGENYPSDAIEAEFTQTMINIAKAGKMPLKDGLEDCLQGLRRRGLKTALATSTVREKVMQYLQYISPLKDAFDAIICGSDVTHGKPEPDIYLLAAKKLNISPADCIGVEDSRNGLLSLKAAGIPSVMIPDMLPYSQTLAPLVTWHLRSLQELCPLIDTLNAKTI